MKTGKTQTLKLTAPDGRIYELTSTPFKDIDGKTKVIEIVRDITKLKETDEKIKESEERFRELFAHMSSGVAIYQAVNKGRDFIFKDFNRAAEKIENVKKKVIIGRSVLEVFPGIKDFGLFDVFKRVWKTGKPEHLPVKLYKDNRITGWRETYVFKLSSGEIVAVYDDVTQRKIAEAKIEESEQRFRKSIMDAPLPIMIHKEDGKVVSINEAWTETTGYTKDEIPTIEAWTKKAFGEKKNLIKDVIDKLYKINKRVDEGEFEIKTKSGDRRIWHFSSAPLGRAPDGGRLVVSMALDVTERKKREEEYKNLINGMNDTVFVINFDGKFVEVNDTAVEVLGYSREELLKMGPNDIDPLLEEKEIKQLIKGMRQGEKQVFITAHKTKSGKIIPVEVSSSLVTYQEKPYILSITRDITIRKKTADALQKSEEQLSLIFNNSSDLLILFAVEEDGTFRIVNVNKTAIETARSLGFEVSKENFIGKTVREIINDFLALNQERLEDMVANFDLAAKSGTPVSYEENYNFGDKSYSAEVSIVPVLDEKGKCIYALWSSHDISERKQATEKLKESEERFQSVIENLPHGVCLHNLDGRIQLVNKAACEMTGYKEEEMLNMNVADIDPGIQTREDRKKLWLKLKKGGFAQIESMHYHKNGSSFPVEIFISAINLKGSPMILAIVHNITKRKEAQEKLKESEERFQTVIENLPDEIFVHGLDGKFTLVNKASCEKTGYTKDELLGMKVEDIDHESISRDDRKNIWLKLHKKGGFARIESTHYRKDGSSYPAEIYFGTVTFKGSPMIIGIAHDITERKKALKELRESEDQLSAIFNNASDPSLLLSVDNDGVFRVVRVNKTAIDTARSSGLDISNESFAGKTLREGMLDVVGLPEEVYNNALKCIKETVKTGKPGLYEEAYNFDKEIFFAEVTTVPIFDQEGNCLYILLTPHDITKTKRTLEKLKESEERFQTVIENLPHAVCVHDLDGNFILVNEALCKYTGYTRDEFLNMTVADVDRQSRTRDDRKNIWLKLKKGGHTHFESELFRKDGSCYPVEIYISAITLEGTPMILAIAQDITERKKTLEKLRESEEKYRNLYDSMTDAFSRTDMKGNIIECNKQYLDMLEYTEDEIKKLKYTDITPEKWHEMEAKIKKEQVVKRGYSDVYEKEYIKKDGTVFPVELRGFLIRDDDGNPQGMWSIVRDITDREKTEKELRKIERLESIGVLAGGIAHDFNNLLTGILGNLSLAQIKEGEDSQELIEDAKIASIQAKNLTQQLLTFAKGGEPIKGEASIESIIKTSSDFNLHGSNVKCLYDFPANLWKVEADKGQLSQVIDNLVINAKQAMPEGGKIRIKAENFVIKEKSTLPLPNGEYIKITFSDDGMGIPEKHLARIFDPYFTTKQKGSGLGLATVFSIIQRHDGYITVESETGKGTTFFLYLPAIAEKIDTKSPETQEELRLRGESKILVMDDEETIRNTLGGILKKLGYSVTLTSRGEEALNEYKKALSSNDPFDAVILDLTIAGGIGGEKTMEELLKIDPNVRAIVSSGYSTDPIMAHYEKYGFKSVAVKPYDVEELINAIRKALE